MKIRSLISLTLCLLCSCLPFSKLQGYVLDLADPHSFSTTCGSVNPAQWGVEQDSCTLCTPELVATMDTIIIDLNIDRTGNLDQDTAWVRYYVNNVEYLYAVVIGDTVPAQGVDFQIQIVVNIGDTIQLCITYKDDHKTEEWMLKDGSIKIWGVIIDLPIELVYFKGEVTNHSVQLEWATTTEIDNHHFDIERSWDGENFMLIGQIEGAGNSSTTQTYHYSDNVLVSGISYYKLKQVDINGKGYSYSNIIAIEVADDNGKFKVYPNPNEGKDIFVSFSELEEDKYLVELFNPLGQLVYAKPMNSYEVQFYSALDYPIDFAPGIYLVAGTNRHKVYTAKLLINGAKATTDEDQELDEEYEEYEDDSKNNKRKLRRCTE